MRRILFCLSWILLSICLPICQSVRAKELSPAQQGSIKQLAQPYVENEVVGGMTIGVIQGDNSQVLGFGQLSKTDDRTADGATLYEIGSMSKVFTGLLLADAVVQGRVKLNQPASELLPKAVKMPTFGEQPITLQHLATHVSGLPRLPDNMVLNANTGPNPYAQYSTRDLYAFLNAYRLERAPGIKSEYSNLAGGLLGVLLASNRQTNYEQLLHERLAKPLKLQSLSPPSSTSGSLLLTRRRVSSR